MRQGLISVIMLAVGLAFLGTGCCIGDGWSYEDEPSSWGHDGPRKTPSERGRRTNKGELDRAKKNLDDAKAAAEKTKKQCEGNVKRTCSSKADIACGKDCSTDEQKACRNGVINNCESKAKKSCDEKSKEAEKRYEEAKKRYEEAKKRYEEAKKHSRSPDKKHEDKSGDCDKKNDNSGDWKDKKDCDCDERP